MMLVETNLSSIHSQRWSNMSEKFLYFTGDSFTAGSELADDYFVEWPGLLDYEDRMYRNPENIEKWLKSVSNLVDCLPEDEFKKFDAIEKQRVWANIVSRELGVKHFNGASGGSSLEAMLHRSVIHFKELEKQNIFPSLAVVQLTDVFRIGGFYDTINMSRRFRGSFRNKFDVSYMLNTFAVNMKAAQFYIGSEGNFGIWIRYLNTLSLINNFFLAKTGKLPIFVDVYLQTMRGEELNELIKNAGDNKDFQNLLEESRILTLQDTELDMSKFQRELNKNEENHKLKLWSPGGHFSPLFNEMFGIHAAKIIGEHL